MKNKITSVSLILVIFANSCKRNCSSRQGIKDIATCLDKQKMPLEDVLSAFQGYYTDTVSHDSMVNIRVYEQPTSLDTTFMQLLYNKRTGVVVADGMVYQ